MPLSKSLVWLDLGFSPGPSALAVSDLPLVHCCGCDSAVVWTQTALELSLPYLHTTSNVLWLGHPPQEQQTWGSIPACAGIFPG